MIIILIVYGLRLRRRNGGLLTFKDALQFTFMSYIIAGLIVAVATYVLYNLVDKTLTQRSFDLGMEKTRAFLQGVGAKPEDIDKEIEKLGSAPKDTSIKTIFLGFGQSLIWDFIKSLLIALIIRKEKPAF
jgi:biotin transporter BioY